MLVARVEIAPLTKIIVLAGEAVESPATDGLHPALVAVVPSLHHRIVDFALLRLAYCILQRVPTIVPQMEVLKMRPMRVVQLVQCEALNALDRVYSPQLVFALAGRLRLSLELKQIMHKFLEIATFDELRHVGALLAYFIDPLFVHELLEALLAVMDVAYFGDGGQLYPLQLAQGGLRLFVGLGGRLLSFPHLLQVSRLLHRLLLLVVVVFLEFAERLDGLE